MANYINRLRQRNLFSQFGGQSPFETVDFGGGTVPPPTDALRKIDFGGNIDFTKQEPRSSDLQEPETKEKDWLTLLREQYKPETEATSRFNELLGQFPEREEPDWKRKLVAGGMALGNVRRKQPMGGIAAAEQVMYAPFERKKADWKEKAGPYYNAANLERQSNINERQLLSEGIKADINQQKADTAQYRARVYELKTQMGRGYTMNARGTTIKVMDTTTGKVTDTGIPTGWMTEADKIAAEGKYDIEAARQRGADVFEGVNLREQETYVDEAGNRYILNPADKRWYPVGDAPEKPQGQLKPDVVPRGAGGTGNTELEEQRARVRKANEMRAKYPDWASKIIIGSQGAVTIKPPTGKGFKDRYDPKEVEQYKEINRYIFGQEPSDLPPSNPFGPDILYPENQPPEGFLGVPGLGGFGGSKQVPGERKPASTPQAPTRPVQQGRLRIRNRKTGRTGDIPNTREAIEAAVAAGNQVETPRNQ